MMVASVRKRARQPVMRLDDKDDAILQTLAQFHYLTVEHVCRLFYAAGSLKYVYAKMKRLVDATYCQRLMLYERSPAKARYVYHLARKGRQYLRSLGVEVAARYRPTELVALSNAHLAHTLACNDFVITARLLDGAMPALRLHDWRHEHALRAAPVRVSLPAGPDGATVTRPVIPDGWLEFRLHTPAGVEQQCVVLELDRAMERRKAWGDKVRRLVAYAAGPYQEAFGTEVITIAVVAAPRDSQLAAKRCAELKTWTEQELTHLGKANHADLFRFTATPPHGQPAEVFAAPVWYTPFATAPTTLLDLSGLHAGVP